MPLVLLERSWWAEFNGIYLIMFGFKMWEEKSVEDVITLGPMAQVTRVQVKFTNGWSEVQSIGCCVALLHNPSVRNSMTVPPQSPPPSPPPQRTAQCSSLVVMYQAWDGACHLPIVRLCCIVTQNNCTILTIAGLHYRNYCRKGKGPQFYH